MLLESTASVAPIVDARQDALEARKRRGAFFTPPQLAAFIARQVIGSRDARVLEPSCGEAVFVSAACTRLRELGADRSVMASQVTACEMHAESIEAARRLLDVQGYSCAFWQGDFLRMPIERRIDAVVGNPPYVRFQVLDARQRAFQQDLACRMGVQLSALASTWAPFVLRACEHLVDGGALGLVLPAELLSVNYAAPIRSFLLHSFAKVQLFTFEQSVFPGVQEEVVVLVARGYREGPSSALSWHQCDSLADVATASGVSFEPHRSADCWLGGLVASDARRVLEGLEADGRVERLGRWGSLALGAVTGANSFFALSPQEAEHRSLRLGDDCMPVLPSGARYLRRLALDGEQWEGLGAAGAHTLLFRPASDALSHAARSYVDEGQELGIDQRYKCRIRSPWWRVPLTVAPDVFMTYMNSFGPNLVANEAGLVHLNSSHGIILHATRREIGMRLLPLAAFNSVSLLSAELVGRSYGGGVQKLEPREAVRLLVPSACVLEAASAGLERLRQGVDDMLQRGNYHQAMECVDAVVLPALGLSDGEVRMVREARERMAGRRARRANKG